MSTFRVLDSYIALKNALTSVFNEELGRLNVGPMQARLLLRLQVSPASMSDLAHATLSDPAAVSRAITSLEDSGLVTKTPAPDDQRKSIVSLTTKGKAEAARAREARDDLGRRLEASLSAKDRGTFVELTEKILKDLESQRSQSKSE